MQFYVFTGWFLLLVQKRNKNMISIKITELEVAYKIRNQFDIGLNATSAVTEEERGHKVYQSAG